MILFSLLQLAQCQIPDYDNINSRSDYDDIDDKNPAAAAAAVKDALAGGGVDKVRYQMAKLFVKMIFFFAGSRGWQRSCSSSRENANKRDWRFCWKSFWKLLLIIHFVDQKTRKGWIHHTYQCLVWFSYRV